MRRSSDLLDLWGHILDAQNGDQMSPFFFIHSAFGRKGWREELTEQPQFTELLSYLVAVVLNYGFPSVLGELSSHAPWKPRVGFRLPSQGPSVAT